MLILQRFYVRTIYFNKKRSVFEVTITCFISVDFHTLKRFIDTDLKLSHKELMEGNGTHKNILKQV